MSEPDPRDLRWTLIVSIYLLWAASGIMQTLASPPAWLLWLNALLAASAVTTWCVVDAKHQGQRIVQVLQVLLFFTWPVGAPVYLVRSRGWFGAFLAIVHSLGLAFTYAIASLLGWAIAVAMLRDSITR